MATIQGPASQTFVGFNDPNGNPLVSLNRDGSVSATALVVSTPDINSGFSLSPYVSNDAGVGATTNRVVMQDLSVSGIAGRRKAFNIYLETACQQSGSDYNGLQVNLGATLTANSSASVGYVNAAEIYALVQGNSINIPHLTALRVRTSVKANSTAAGVNAIHAYLPTFEAGSVTGSYCGFNLDAAPNGSGTVTTVVGVQCTWNTNALTCTNSFGGIFGGGNTAVSAAIILDDTTNTGVKPSSIVWGSPFVPTIHNGIYSGNGSPLNVVVAEIGSMFLRRDGGAGTTLYIKESGAGASTGWVAK